MNFDNVKEQLRQLETTLNNAEHNLYREITSYDINALQEKCMGDDLYKVQFHYTVQFIGRENTVYVDTRYYGYWKLEAETNEWIKVD